MYVSSVVDGVSWFWPGDTVTCQEAKNRGNRGTGLKPDNVRKLESYRRHDFVEIGEQSSSFDEEVFRRVVIVDVKRYVL
jgi:hypothetical protein